MIHILAKRRYISSTSSYIRAARVDIPTTRTSSAPPHTCSQSVTLATANPGSKSSSLLLFTAAVATAVFPCLNSPFPNIGRKGDRHQAMPKSIEELHGSARLPSVVLLLPSRDDAAAAAMICDAHASLYEVHSNNT